MESLATTRVEEPTTVIDGTETNEKRIYDCVTFTGRHETAEVEFDDGQTHVTIYDDNHYIANMWNDDSTDPADVVNGIENMYLRIARIWK